MGELQLSSLYTPTNVDTEMLNYLKYGLAQKPLYNKPGAVYNANNNTTNSANLMNLGNLSDKYTKGLSLGPDGKIYDNSINDMLNMTLAKKGLNAGPTVENAKLLKNGTNSLDSKDNLFGMSTGKWDNMLKMGQLGLGAGQLGLGIMGYLDNKKTAEIQRNLLNQQYANNAELIADRRANKNALGKLHLS